MSTSSRPSPPSDNPVDPNYLFLIGRDDNISTFELFTADPDQYSHYCVWYASRLDSRKFRNPMCPIEVRIAAYLRLVAGQRQRFRLGRHHLPSATWLREHLGIHRNTMGKYIKDAQTVGRVQLSLTVGCQLAFVTAIYPPPTELEENALRDVLEHRLDLINDYHLSGRKKANMVRCLTRIINSGENDLFTVPKRYPRLYDLDTRGLPIKWMSQHTARKPKRRKKRVAK